MYENINSHPVHNVFNHIVHSRTNPLVINKLHLNFAARQAKETNRIIQL